MIIDGKTVLNPEVIIARRLESAGRSVRDLEFIRWRFQRLRLEVIGEAAYWEISFRDIARSRAEQLATARGAAPVMSCIRAKSLTLLAPQTTQPELSESAREARGE